MILALIQMLFAFAVLLKVAVSDFRFGVVKDSLWFYGLIGGFLTCLHLLVEPELFLTVSVGFLAGLICAVGLVLVRVGGADVRAMVFLSLAVPVDWFSGLIILPLLVLSLSSILALPVLLFQKMDGIRFLPYFLVGYTLVVFLGQFIC